MIPVPCRLRLLLPILLSLSGNTLAYVSSQQVLCKAEEVTAHLAVVIRIAERTDDSWGTISYTSTFTDENLLKYLDLLIYEYCKYPDGYLQRSRVEAIILATDLAFNGQPRAAIPDPYKKQLFLSINGAYAQPSTRYLSHVMHHELHHCTEFSLWNSMTYDWKEWQQLNDSSFCYGDGGGSAYLNSHTLAIDYYSPSNPQKGFVNLYSLTGDEEDRAEIMAYIMTDSERNRFLGIHKKDLIIQAKARLLHKLLQEYTYNQMNLPGIN